MKTINKAAKEFAESEIMETYDSVIEELKRISFIHGAKFAQEWISVEDELPSTLNRFINKIVLIKSPNGQVIETAKYSSEKQKWLYTSISNRHPAYWRPIERE